MLECIKAGIPMSQLPPLPSADASFKEKSRHTWALRKAWQQKTGRKIERLTPPGYYDKITERRRLAREAREAVTASAAGATGSQHLHC
ncbi:hypothetical protein HF251_23130 [Rhizobium leguminosarum]|uniref:hypothetical protein n=1 Tax=Rhizobium leguminosarum TaxID=384 RepID=UPI001C915F6C|nr:hypothetical protein [Rhizobium leguminosarum]MBY2965554.1 hypothetical protein [Rhizobium leguminosarum]